MSFILPTNISKRFSGNNIKNIGVTKKLQIKSSRIDMLKNMSLHLLFEINDLLTLIIT
ncbi:hypothetical protein K2F41_10260 [Clostridium sp. CM027]|uniref:hypothetical protein n=1 Tax=Clostridium sp. CM027 TaxID=2849865 RepID=UPI001C6EF354|nr:hypothetical protein [Clostridium sp. CM027]MBW9145929.1 hypothetical protein [Clostridium sp. CM027]